MSAGQVSRTGKPARSLTTRYLKADDASRLYREHPHIKASPQDYCPTCDTTGQYFWRGENHPCDCEAQLQLHKHYLSSGIGVTYQRLSWDDYEGDPTLQAQLDKYLSKHANFINHGIGVLLYGEFGTGKTFGVTLLLKDLLKAGYTCYSTTFADMVEMFTAGWKSVEDQKYFQKKIMYSDVLLLDDLGRELKTRNKLSESTFDNVLRRRVQDGRPTFITTNMSLVELSEGYGGAILSLLKEKSISYEVNGIDFRPTANSKLLREVTAGESRPIF